MKARWPFLASVICFIIAYALPYILYWNEISSGAESFGDIIWLIIAPGVFSVWSWPFWIAGCILLLVSIVVFVTGRK